MAYLFRPLTAFTLAAGINTAYSAPSGTAIAVKTFQVATNISATAGGNYTAYIAVGPSGAYRMWQPETAITAGGRIVMNAAIALNAANWYIMVSASTGSALDVLAFGLEMT